MRSETRSDIEPQRLPVPYDAALPGYRLDDAYDEMFAADGQVRPEYQELLKAFLEMPAEEFVEVWKRLPLSDIEIAEMLGLTRQQVINLRKCARERLARNTGGYHRGQW